MSLEDRVTSLEKGLREVQTEFLVHLSENNRHMAALNKVITQQEINSRDADHNLTMLLGMVTGQGKDIRVIKSDLVVVKGRLGQVESRLDSVDGRLDRVESRLDGLDQRFNVVDQRFDSLDQKFDRMLQLLVSLTGKLGTE